MSTPSDRLHDAIAQAYGANDDPSTAQRLKSALPASLVSGGERMLDIGCANGVHLARLGAIGADIVGVDRSGAMLDEARTKVPAATFLRADATSLPFPDASFDIVTSFSTLLIVDDIDIALDEIERVVRPGGLVVLDIAGRWNLSVHAWRWWYRRRGHRWLHAYSLAGAEAMLATHQLAVEASHASGFTDQWQYLPLVRKARSISRIFHEGAALDRDYRISNARVLRKLANRWYLVARRADDQARRREP